MRCPKARPRPKLGAMRAFPAIRATRDAEGWLMRVNALRSPRLGAANSSEIIWNWAASSAESRCMMVLSVGAASWGMVGGGGAGRADLSPVDEAAQGFSKIEAVKKASQGPTA